MSASTSRRVQVPGATVISYYVDADGQFGNIKVGYDVARFDEAVREYLVVNEFRTKKVTTTTPGAELEEKMDSLTTENAPNGSNGVSNEPIQIKKEDTQLICSQLEVTPKVAERALKASHGNLAEALLYLIRK
ncbi:uncharacterized protein MELLADRAFT_110415 [Melampsora larici-populina 98AG31]|uniref:Nascent polypeptide-associated complex subunit alpha-like UBA domain-containing protein n=1 Tax=Melampsora larici-populina (strain 98AG31 / pathotype 3-4-7) TaxID=747676 RepID=F4RZR2_MELLP|nr:uncharacterized protein MELLADRAFT_110415 [Melampsora larici-populina 98AG31]EGG02047.1 hypothetical protein MELLADRAFT_110415 [Melampsora larici-populina 98AG31]